MTAPPLPPCPVCGKEPDVMTHGPIGRDGKEYVTSAVISCFSNERGFHHDVTVVARRLHFAVRRWRRVAGGAEVRRLLDSFAFAFAVGLAAAVVLCVVWEAACR